MAFPPPCTQRACSSNIDRDHLVPISLFLQRPWFEKHIEDLSPVYELDRAGGHIKVQEHLIIVAIAPRIHGCMQLQTAISHRPKGLVPLSTVRAIHPCSNPSYVVGNQLRVLTCQQRKTHDIFVHQGEGSHPPSPTANMQLQAGSVPAKWKRKSWHVFEQVSRDSY